MLLNSSISTLSRLLKTKEISSVDLAKESLTKIDKYNNSLNYFITVRDQKELLAEAEKLDKQREDNSSLLWGIPFSMKDAYVTKDIRTTAGSKVLGDFVPPYSATVYEKLRKNGALLIGKNNQDAWGHGGSTQNTDYNPASNPWDTDRISGGSSGGSAISVATRTTSFAIGEDTGGSIRNPSSMCNICGLKPTYGRVSRYGAIAYASSLDTVGPMAASVEDLAYILEVIAGNDPKDGTSSHQKVDQYPLLLNGQIKEKTIGLPKEFFGEGIDPEVKDTILQAAKEFEKLGVRIKEVGIPALKYGISIYYLIALSETSSNLGRYDGIRFGNGRDLFTEETAKRIMVGTFALSAGYSEELYKNAQKARTLLIQEYDQVFEGCDAVLAPVTPSITPKKKEMESDPLKMYLDDLYTGTVNLVGLPSLALPAGFTQNTKLPIGMQLIGKKFHEGELFQFGHSYQQVTNWHTMLPNIVEQ